MEKHEGMKYCYKCGEQIFEEAEICPECGVRQKQPPETEQSQNNESEAIPTGNPSAGEAFNLLLAHYQEKTLRAIFHLIIVFLTGGIWLGWFFGVWIRIALGWSNIEKLRKKRHPSKNTVSNNTPTTNKSKKNAGNSPKPLDVVLLSFFLSGAGHLYMDEDEKGIGLMCGEIFLWIMLLAAPIMRYFTILIIVIIKIYAIIDSNKIAETRKKQYE